MLDVEDCIGYWEQILGDGGNHFTARTRGFIEATIQHLKAHPERQKIHQGKLFDSSDKTMLSS